MIINSTISLIKVAVLVCREDVGDRIFENLADPARKNLEMLEYNLSEPGNGQRRKHFNGGYYIESHQITWEVVGDFNSMRTVMKYESYKDQLEGEIPPLVKKIFGGHSYHLNITRFEPIPFYIFEAKV